MNGRIEPACAGDPKGGFAIPAETRCRKAKLGLFGGHIHYERVSKRCERPDIELFRACEIRNGKTAMVDHAKLLTRRRRKQPLRFHAGDDRMASQ